MRNQWKIVSAGMVAVALLLLGAALLVPMRTHAPPPLPFATNGFVSTRPVDMFPAPPRPASWEHLKWQMFMILQKFSGPPKWTFGASAPAGCSVQGLLNQCTDVSGTRYFMPIGVAAGMVQFGNSNTLDGPHWVAAFEAALAQGPVECWSAETKQTGPEQLALLRFPAQKAIVVLPKASVAGFLLTNGIRTMP